MFLNPTCLRCCQSLFLNQSQRLGILCTPKSHWVIDLSEVYRQWGFNSSIMADCQVAVRQKGIVDETLFIQTVLITSSQRTQFPSIQKIASAATARAKHQSNLTRKTFVYFLLQTFSTTSTIQEMDDQVHDLYEKTDSNSQEIFEEKIFQCSFSQKSYNEDGKMEVTITLSTVDLQHFNEMCLRQVSSIHV